MVIIKTRENSTMGYKRGINTCVECERKMKENPDDTGMCPKCGKAQNRIESTVYKELMDEGRFP
jgi:Zn finger protein HypA/HybF involved in hydrogenase expression